MSYTPGVIYTANAIMLSHKRQASDWIRGNANGARIVMASHGKRKQVADEIRRIRKEKRENNK